METESESSIGRTPGAVVVAHEMIGSRGEQDTQGSYCCYRHGVVMVDMDDRCSNPDVSPSRFSFRAFV